MAHGERVERIGNAYLIDGCLGRAFNSRRMPASAYDPISADKYGRRITHRYERREAKRLIEGELDALEVDRG